MPHSNIQALLTLLDDPDESIALVVENELLRADPEILPELLKAREQAPALQQERLIKVIDHLRFQQTANQLSQWANMSTKPLLKGWWLASTIHYPELPYEGIKKLVSKLVTDIKSELNETLTSLEKTSVLNHVLFEVYHFEINTLNFTAPQNALLNDIMASRKGNPISMAILYSMIAQEVHLPIYPLNFERNLFLGYYDPEKSRETFGEDASPILFYINPVNKGAIIGQKEMAYYLKKEKVIKEKKPIICENNVIIERLLLSMEEAYKANGMKKKILQVRELYKKIRCPQ